MWLLHLSPMVTYLVVSAFAFVLLKPLMALNDAFKLWLPRRLKRKAENRA